MKEETRQNLQLIKSFYQAVANGDMLFVRDALDPQVEWLEPSLPGLWFGGIHCGADAIIDEVIEPSAKVFANFRVRVKRLFPVGEHVIAIGAFRGQTRINPKQFKAPTAHIWTLHRGKIIRFEGFHDLETWRHVLRLSEAEQMAA